jgi:hypothetical protein
MKTKTLVKNIKAANKLKKNDTFLYELYQTVIYKSGMFELYKNQPAKIIKRSTEKGYYKWYIIEFEDGYVLQVKESWIGNIENVESEEITNEN